MAKVHVAVDKLGGSLDDLSIITANTREVVVLNKEQLNRTLANLKEASDHMKAAGKEIRANPWRLLYQPTLAEAESANVLGSARAFSEAAARLDDAIVRLQALSQATPATQPANDQQLAEIRDQLKRTFDDFNKAEKALWENLKVK